MSDHWLVGRTVDTSHQDCTSYGFKWCLRQLRSNSTNTMKLFLHFGSSNSEAKYTSYCRALNRSKDPNASGPSFSFFSSKPPKPPWTCTYRPPPIEYNHWTTVLMNKDKEFTPLITSAKGNGSTQQTLRSSTSSPLQEEDSRGFRQRRTAGSGQVGSNRVSFLSLARDESNREKVSFHWRVGGIWHLVLLGLILYLLYCFFISL